MSDTDLLQDIRRDDQGQWRHWARAVILLLFTAFILTALIGVFDQRGSAEHSENGVSATLEYPRTTRGGEDIALDLSLRSDQELPSSITVVLDHEYSTLFEDFAISPVAEEQTDSLEELRFAVTTGEGRSARVTIDGRTADSWAPRTSGTLKVHLDADTEFEFDITTWRLP
ncbi:hypothetical protein [Micrococcoides hystricis]|uniref:DUF2771 family protein n=1 Tax=Micrococcoides hystricis TaxID=1572761 RepID=A0ABV6P816_9MICC